MLGPPSDQTHAPSAATSLKPIQHASAHSLRTSSFSPSDAIRARCAPRAPQAASAATHESAAAPTS